MARRAKGDVYNTGYSQVVPRQGTSSARQEFTSGVRMGTGFFILKRLRRAVYLQITIISNVYIYLVFHMHIFMTMKI